MNPTLPARLRLGILLDSFELPAWAHRMLEVIRNSDHSTVELLILNDGASPRRTPWRRLSSSWPHLAYTAYRKLENRLYHPRPDAFAPMDVRSLLPSVAALPVTPERARFSDRFAGEDIARLRELRLDVLIRLGFRILRGEILQVARLGVWSYHHGDTRVRRGAQAGFREVFEHDPVTGATLQVLTEDLDGGIVLSRSYSATDPLLVNRNRNSLYWRALSMLPRKLSELHRDGAEAFRRRHRIGAKSLDVYCHPMYRKPTNGRFLGMLVRHLARHAGTRLAHRLFLDQWILLFDLRDDATTPMWRFRKILPPKDRCWADPHVVRRNDQYYIFVEELAYSAGKGHISVIRMDGNGGFEAPVKVLEQPYHLSNPFMFRWQDNDYMMPESSANATIELYRCVEFPHRWTRKTVLMSGVKAYDPTLHFDGDRWWLFVNMVEHEGASSWDELFLFSADSPLSERWHPHPKNPIVSDVRRSRPAGRLFSHQGVLFRPAQDCSRGYGHAVHLQEVLELSDENYRERQHSSIEPLWDPCIKAVHTFSRCDRLSVVDAKFRRWRLFR